VLFRSVGVKPVENTPDEILETAREMLDRLEGKEADIADDRALERRLKALLETRGRGVTTARLGRYFLEKHRALLE